jgi:hypothetical protein
MSLYLLPAGFSSLIRNETNILFGRKSISFVSKYQSERLSLELVQKNGSYVNFFKYVLMKKYKEVNSWWR